MVEVMTLYRINYVQNTPKWGKVKSHAVVGASSKAEAERMTSSLKGVEGFKLVSITKP